MVKRILVYCLATSIALCLVGCEKEENTTTTVSADSNKTEVVVTQSDSTDDNTSTEQEIPDNNATKADEETVEETSNEPDLSKIIATFGDSSSSFEGYLPILNSYGDTIVSLGIYDCGWRIEDVPNMYVLSNDNHEILVVGLNGLSCVNIPDAEHREGILREGINNYAKSRFPNTSLRHLGDVLEKHSIKAWHLKEDTTGHSDLSGYDPEDDGLFLYNVDGRDCFVLPYLFWKEENGGPGIQLSIIQDIGYDKYIDLLFYSEKDIDSLIEKRDNILDKIDNYDNPEDIQLAIKEYRDALDKYIQERINELAFHHNDACEYVPVLEDLDAEWFGQKAR